MAVQPKTASIEVKFFNGFNDIAIPRPAGLAAGDLMIAQVGQAQGTTMSAPAGWTLLTPVLTGHLMAWRVATASEPDRYKFLLGGDNDAVGIISTYTGQHATPIDTTARGFYTAASPITAPAVTANFPGGLVVRAITCRNVRQTFGPVAPAGVTKRGDPNNQDILILAWGDSAQGPNLAVPASAWACAGSFDGLSNYGQTVVIRQANVAPTAPVLSAPNGGENYTTSMTVSWAAATDSNFDVLSYEVEFSSDGGATWSVLATGITGTSYTHNAATLPATQKARVRVRANDGLRPGPYDTSDANFTINRAPAAPTLSAPADNTVANLRGGYPFSWAHNDTDLQTQASYAFMRTRGTVTQWWDGNAWVNTEFYVASAAGSVTFPAGFWPAGSYTWTVSTRDTFGAKSAYAVARRITSTGGLSMVV